jgi:hypothetical protein
LLRLVSLKPQQIDIKTIQFLLQTGVCQKRQIRDRHQLHGWRRQQLGPPIIDRLKFLAGWFQFHALTLPRSLASGDRQRAFEYTAVNPYPASMNPGEFRADRTLLLPPDGIEWRPADMTATFGAQVRWEQLSTHENLWLPVDCQGNPSATVGRLVEANQTGPLRLGFGGWRDLLLGCQFFDGEGRLITAGGCTVKNVAGYDLTKFMAGQSGIFGKLLTITTRIYRKPERSLLAEFPPRIEILNRLLASSCRPQWATMSSQLLTCGYLGAVTTIDFYLAQLPAWKPIRIEPGDFAADSQWRSKHWRAIGNNTLSMRASVPPTRIAEFAAAAALKDWIADAAFGVVLGSVESSEMATSAAAAVGGRAWFWKTAGDQSLAAFSPSPPEKRILERLKKAFDPNNRLAALPWS